MSFDVPRATKYLDRAMDDTGREYYTRLAAGEPATTRCPRCARTSFPPRERCPDCSAPTEWVALPRRGTLEAFTTQETAVRFAAPAVLALVRLGEAVVPAVAEGPLSELRLGDVVDVETRPEPDLGMTLLHVRRVAA